MARPQRHMDSEDETSRAFDALSRARRDGVSLTHAAGEVGLSRADVLRHTGEAWERRGRRYVPKANDRLTREMGFLTPRGPVWMTTHSSRGASLISEHANAVRTYLETGEDTALERFRGKSIVIGGRRHEFVTDLRVIDRLAQGSELHYELYRR